MNVLFERCQKLSVDTSLFCLERREDVLPYFCYPLNALPIGFEGCILHCFLDGYGDMVFASNPESCTSKYVYPLAVTFEDFLRLILACGTANPLEQVVWMDRERFDQHLREEPAQQTNEQKAALTLLARELQSSPITNPFGYVKALQADFDDRKIPFSAEYYDILGLESPNGRCLEPSARGFAFPPVIIEGPK